MDQLRKGIHLRGYAQKNPEQEYKRESFDLFQSMLGAIRSDTVQDLSRVHVPTPEEIKALQEERRLAAERMQMQFEHQQAGSLMGGEADTQPINHQSRPRTNMSMTFQNGISSAATAMMQQGQGQATPTATNTQRQGTDSMDNHHSANPYAHLNLSRNASCPCGSGLKYKQCHGKL